MQGNPASFGAAFMGALSHLKPVKPYEVTKLSGQVKRKVFSYEQTSTRKVRKKDGSYDEKAVFALRESVKLEDAGYLVKFPNGHSIRVRDDEELKRLGFDLEPGFISFETGDVIMPNYEKMVSQIETMRLLSDGYVPAGQKAEDLIGSVVALEDGGMKTASASKKRAAPQRKAQGTKLAKKKGT